MKKLYIPILLFILAIHTQAQNAAGTIKGFMQKVQQAYSQASYLDFRVLYRYANQNQPGRFTDSLLGEMAIDKDRMRFVIDDVETITTSNYIIRVMKEEKLIYLAKASPVILIDPLNMIDTVLSHVKDVQANMVRNNGQATLHIGFPPGQQYKNISVTMNESTGYFQKVVYELYTEDLVGQDLIEKPGKSAPYQSEGLIEVSFSNYRQGHVTDVLFNEGRYITRQGPGQFEPSEQYKDYRIFLASVNL